MKTTYVTIQEFLDNGGILLKGRMIYIEKTKNNFSYTGDFKEIDNDLIIIQNASRSFPVIPEVFFVEIEVIPVYK